MFKILPSSYFEIYKAELLTVFNLLCNKTARLSSSNCNFAPSDQPLPRFSPNLQSLVTTLLFPTSVRSPSLDCTYDCVPLKFYDLLLLSYTVTKLN